jgi:hypothetical protein
MGTWVVLAPMGIRNYARTVLAASSTGIYAKATFEPYYKAYTL